MFSRKTESRYKVLLLGDSNVGKTSLLVRYSEDVYTPSRLSTLGIDFRIKTEPSTLDPNETVKLQIWDTAGQERFKSVTSQYFRGVHGVLLIYDITEPKTFSSVATWIRELDESAGRNVIKILVGNKSDSETRRAVPVAKAESFALQYDLIHMTTSALTGENVYEIFRLLLFEIEKQKWSPRYFSNLKERSIVLEPEPHSTPSRRTYDPPTMRTYKHRYFKESKCC